MKRSYLFTGLVCTLFVAGQAYAGAVNGIVVFGDSLSDPGNVFHVGIWLGGPARWRIRWLPATRG